MQTVETLNEGLKRAYTLTITAKDIEGKVDAELKRIAPQMKMPGFRPGKVPTNLVRKMHGPALLQDALNTALQEGVQSLIAEKNLRPAMQPQVELVGEYEQGKDATLNVTLEVLPQVPTPAIDALKLERLTVPVADEAVDEQLQQVTFLPEDVGECAHRCPSREWTPRDGGAVSAKVSSEGSPCGHPVPAAGTARLLRERGAQGQAAPLEDGLDSRTGLEVDEDRGKEVR